MLARNREKMKIAKLMQDFTWKLQAPKNCLHLQNCEKIQDPNLRQKFTWKMLAQNREK